MAGIIVTSDTRGGEGVPCVTDSAAQTARRHRDRQHTRSYENDAAADKEPPDAARPGRGHLAMRFQPVQAPGANH